MYEPSKCHNQNNKIRYLNKLSLWTTFKFRACKFFILFTVKFQIDTKSFFKYRKDKLSNKYIYMYVTDNNNDCGQVLP